MQQLGLAVGTVAFHVLTSAVNFSTAALTAVFAALGSLPPVGVLLPACAVVPVG